MNELDERTQQEKSFEIESLNNGRIQLSTHTTLEGVLPHQAYDFLVSMDEERYRVFHPKDHKTYKVLHQPEHGIVGTIVYLKEEYENGYISSAKAKFIEATPDKKIVLQSISPWWQPCTLVFMFNATDNGTVITHHMQIGSSFPIIGVVYNKIVKCFFLSKENITAIYTHVKEEYRNLESMLQKKRGVGQMR
jgi:hypothetical protein